MKKQERCGVIGCKVRAEHVRHCRPFFGSDKHTVSTIRLCTAHASDWDGRPDMYDGAIGDNRRVHGKR